LVVQAAANSVKIYGYTQAIPQPFLEKPDGGVEDARCGDARLQLSDEQLISMGNEAAAITFALNACEPPCRPSIIQ